MVLGGTAAAHPVRFILALKKSFCALIHNRRLNPRGPSPADPPSRERVEAFDTYNGVHGEMLSVRQRDQECRTTVEDRLLYTKRKAP